MEEAIKDDMETTNGLQRYGYFQNLGGSLFIHPPIYASSYNIFKFGLTAQATRMGEALSRKHPFGCLREHRRAEKKVQATVGYTV